jgi:hypothetical protein
MKKLCILVAAGSLVLGTVTAASADIFPATVDLSVAIGTLPPAGFTGSAPAASSDGPGAAATLPAGAISGVFQTAISPPLIGLIDGIGVAAPGVTGDFATGASPASNEQLNFDGTTGTMALNASAYLLMSGAVLAEIPLNVVGVGGTQMFDVLGIVSGTIFANPYQLGMLTVMGSLNGANHTISGTGVDSRNPDGSGTLTLISPTNVSLGALGSLASIATLTIEYAGEGPPPTPEPGTLLLLGTGVLGLVMVGRKKLA